MSRRTAGAAGTLALPVNGSHLPRRVARQGPTNRAGGGRRSTDWFRIQNHATDSGTTEIYIYDEIGFWGTSAQDFIQQMMGIDTPNIDLHLNSPGGEVFDGVAIYNALKTHAAYVTVYVDALAASAASFIAQAGDKIIMLDSSTMMIHDAMGICIGNQQDMADSADLLGRISNNIADIYAKNAGGTIPEWRAVMTAEAWYNPQEAVDAGLADEVATVPTEATNHWDLTVFNYAGRQNAPAPDQIRTAIINKLKENPVADAADTKDTKAAGTATAPAAAAAVAPAAATAATDDGQLTNRVSHTFVINGVNVTDPTKVQNYISTLEAAQGEAKEAARRAFIKDLCDTKKITAAQVTDLEELVLGTDDEPGMTDKQYDRWSKTWNVAGPVAGLQSVTSGVSNSDGNKPHEIAGADAATDAIEVAKQIVASNRHSMPKAQLEKTASWAKLVAAGIDPNTI